MDCWLIVTALLHSLNGTDLNDNIPTYSSAITECIEVQIAASQEAIRPTKLAPVGGNRGRSWLVMLCWDIFCSVTWKDELKFKIDVLELDFFWFCTIYCSA